MQPWKITLPHCAAAAPSRQTPLSNRCGLQSASSFSDAGALPSAMLAVHSRVSEIVFRHVACSASPTVRFEALRFEMGFREVLRCSSRFADFVCVSGVTSRRAYLADNARRRFPAHAASPTCCGGFCGSLTKGRGHGRGKGSAAPAVDLWPSEVESLPPGRRRFRLLSPCSPRSICGASRQGGRRGSPMTSVGDPLPRGHAQRLPLRPCSPGGRSQGCRRRSGWTCQREVTGAPAPRDPRSSDLGGSRRVASGARSLKATRQVS